MRLSRYLGLGAFAGAVLGGALAVGIAELVRPSVWGAYFLGAACGLVGYVATWMLWPKE